jgi:hypothetical protein
VAPYEDGNLRVYPFRFFFSIFDLTLWVAGLETTAMNFLYQINKSTVPQFNSFKYFQDSIDDIRILKEQYRIGGNN